MPRQIQSTSESNPGASAVLAGTLAFVADRITGGERGREDRLTDRIGLGVLTRLVHRDLVDEVLVDTGRTELRRRLLPARVVVCVA